MRARPGGLAHCAEMGGGYVCAHCRDDSTIKGKELGATTHLAAKSTHNSRIHGESNIHACIFCHIAGPYPARYKLYIASPSVTLHVDDSFLQESS